MTQAPSESASTRPVSWAIILLRPRARPANRVAGRTIPHGRREGEAGGGVSVRSAFPACGSEQNFVDVDVFRLADVCKRLRGNSAFVTLARNSPTAPMPDRVSHDRGMQREEMGWLAIRAGAARPAGEGQPFGHHDFERL